MMSLKDDYDNKRTCFVIMGYGIKTDPNSGKQFDLNKTFSNIIEPVVKKIGYRCIRCDKLNNSGLIDKPMYDFILNSELVIADITTLNANAMYELGIRHALKPSTTVIIAEKNTNFPFDINHTAIFTYEHLGADIGASEAKRCVKELSKHIKNILENENIDSPFYSYLKYNKLSDLCRDEILKSYVYDEAFYREHTFCALIPKWSDTNENDKKVFLQLLNNNLGDFETNINKLKDIPTSPLKLNNYHWEYSVNSEIAKHVYSHFTPSMMEKFKTLAIDVLLEKDPKFELPKEERLMANITGHVPNYSRDLRAGFAESLAYLSLYQDDLGENVKNLNIPFSVIHSVLNTADWKIWGSLDNLLPTLAEASPEAFISALKNSITKSPETFICIFEQEDSGIFGGTLMSGILWALEDIAWFPNYFGQVIECLAQLALLDKGGNYTNRPINSIETLLLPWINTTTASADDKIGAVNYLSINYPDLLWKIIFHLLPNINNWTSGCKKPDFFIQLTADYKQKTSKEDYLKQIKRLSEIVFILMTTNSERFITVLNNLNSLNEETVSKIFSFLLSLNFEKLPVEEKFYLWKQTNSIIHEHKKFANADWSYDEKILTNIQKFNDLLKPDSIIDLYKPLFERNEMDLSDETYDDSNKTDWNEIKRKSKEIRNNALNEVITNFGLKGLFSLLYNETSSANVAITLAEMHYTEFDKQLFPTYLNSDDECITVFISQYIRVAGYLRDNTWLNGLNIEQWNKTQIINFLINLPFEKSTWDIAKKYLNQDYIEYWKTIKTNPYSNDSDLNEAAKEFIQCERIDFALKCAYFSIISKKPIDENLIILILKKNVNSESPLLDNHEIIMIFQHLEESKIQDSEELSEIEFTYYPFFRMTYENLPKTLYKRIQLEPELYMQLISYVYKREDQLKDIEFTEEQKVFAQISWNILNNFKLVPGLTEDNLFDPETAVNWIDSVCRIAKDNKQLSITKINLGNLFFHTPRDASLWIDKTIAHIFDKLENEEMRRGFSTEAINSRGAHFSDPTGESEKEIANTWIMKANELEKNGFYNFAQTARDIAKDYLSFANNNITNL